MSTKLENSPSKKFVKWFGFFFVRNNFRLIEFHHLLREVYDGGVLRECSLSENGAERSDMVGRTSLIIVRGNQTLRGRV